MLSFDFQITLLGDLGDRLTIESSFELMYPGGASIGIEPGRITEESTKVLELLHLPILKSSVDDDGTLTVRFDRILLVVRPDDQFEAWNMNRTDGTLIVCLPGSGLATFQSTDK